MLHELAEEFQCQAMVSTHRPYMLIKGRPEAIVLLERCLEAARSRRKRRVDTTRRRLDDAVPPRVAMVSDVAGHACCRRQMRDRSTRHSVSQSATGWQHVSFCIIVRNDVE